MIKTKRILQLVGSVTLLISSGIVFAQNTDANEKNTSLQDPRVPGKYLPLERSTVGDSTSYTFVDKESVKIHPYNALIKTFTRVINYGPALEQDKDGETVPYRSMISQEFVNCDQKEVAKGLIQTYENYFGEGDLQSTNDKPKRWEKANSNSKEYQNLIVICSLPVNK